MRIVEVVDGVESCILNRVNRVAVMNSRTKYTCRKVLLEIRMIGYMHDTFPAQRSREIALSRPSDAGQDLHEMYLNSACPRGDFMALLSLFILINWIVHQGPQEEVGLQPQAFDTRLLLGTFVQTVGEFHGMAFSYVVHLEPVFVVASGKSIPEFFNLIHEDEWRLRLQHDLAGVTVARACSIYRKI